MEKDFSQKLVKDYIRLFAHRRKCDQHDRSVGKVKHEEELYAKISIDAGIDGESEEEFDARAIKILLSREFGEEVDEVKSNIEEDKAVDESAEINCKVTVGNFMKKSSSESCESFLRQFEGVVMVKPEVKNARKEGTGAVEVFEGSYEVTFKDSSSADKSSWKKSSLNRGYCRKSWFIHAFIAQEVSSSNTISENT